MSALAARAGHAGAEKVLFAFGMSRRRAMASGLLAMLTMGVLLWVDPLGDVLGQLGALNPEWLSVAVGLELASCLSYVLVFRRLFEPAAGRKAGKPAWVGLGAGAVLPGGNISGAVISGLLLHRRGAPKRQLVERSSALLLLINAVGVAATAIAGALLLSGGVAGPQDLLRAGLPIMISVAIAGLVIAIPFMVRRAGNRAPAWVMQISNGVGDAGRLLRRPNWRLLGAVGYPIFDMAALWAACAATGHTPGFAVLILAYNVGYLASILPLPAGVGVLEGGLTAALILYGASPAAALAAVLVYHALAVWVPALGGLTAWVLLRREDHLLRGSAGAAVQPSGVSSATGLARQLA